MTHKYTKKVLNIVNNLENAYKRTMITDSTINRIAKSNNPGDIELR